MRLRTFSAKTMPEAMAMVRKHLGVEAIILSTHDASGAVSVTAALEEPDPQPARRNAPSDAPALDSAELVHETLVAHGVPARLVDGVLAAALELMAPDAILALAGGL